jgi:hypothetical protein
MSSCAGQLGARLLHFRRLIDRAQPLFRYGIALAIGMLICRPSGIRAQASSAGLHEVLVREFGFSAADLDAVSRGEIVAKAVPTQDERDVAVVAVARADRRIRGSLTTGHGTIHVFAQPASVADVQDVRVTRGDVDELRRCRPSSCNFKLPAPDMEAFRGAMDSAGADPSDRVTAYVRRRIVDYVNAYREQGSAAMVVYADLGSVESSAAFDAMMRDSSRLVRAAPALARYMDAYPRDALAGATSTILWSVDAMPRLRPVLRIVHHVVYEPADDPATMFVVSKQLYADHYFEAGLEALLFTDAANAGFESPGGNAVLVETRRYRFDHLPSGGLFDLRGRVIGALRAAVADDVKKLRDVTSRNSSEER